MRENVGIHLVDVRGGYGVVVAVYVTTFVVDLGDMVVGDASYLDLKRQTYKHQGRATLVYLLRDHVHGWESLHTRVYHLCLCGCTTGTWMA